MCRCDRPLEWASAPSKHVEIWCFFFIFRYSVDSDDEAEFMPYRTAFNLTRSAKLRAAVYNQPPKFH